MQMRLTDWNVWLWVQWGISWSETTLSTSLHTWQSLTSIGTLSGHRRQMMSTGCIDISSGEHKMLAWCPVFVDFSAPSTYRTNHPPLTFPTESTDSSEKRLSITRACPEAFFTFRRIPDAVHFPEQPTSAYSPSVYGFISSYRGMRFLTKPKPPILRPYPDLQDDS